MRAAAALLSLAAASSAGAQSGPSALYDLMCGRTAHFYSAGIGTQIEYTAPDGVAYLWYPEEREIIVGTWDVGEMSDGIVELCYTYGPGAFGNVDGSVFCFDYVGLVSDLVTGGLRNGDPYDLTSEAVPFILARDEAVDPADLREMFDDDVQPQACVGLFS